LFFFIIFLLTPFCPSVCRTVVNGGITPLREVLSVAGEAWKKNAAQMWDYNVETIKRWTGVHCHE
jgi:hypothetical protein